MPRLIAIIQDPGPDLAALPRAVTSSIGFLAGRPGAVSAAAAGMATECVHCAWSEVKHLEDRAQDRAIYLRGDVFTRLWVFCTPENHATVRAFVLAHVRR